jgi:HTH-type transcriptional regulator, transcriptional repressor of NAD biosynthesis genes
MTRLICLHGPESTGKTTLAAPLADHFGTIWVPEYGRAYCRLHGFDLDAADLVAIGREQSAATRAAMAEAKDLLIVDTDALTTAAWSLMILGQIPHGVLDDWPRPDLYLLTDVDIPWEDDGTRYFPADADRARFMAACERVIEEASVRHVRLSGSREERLAQAIAAVEAL